MSHNNDNDSSTNDLVELQSYRFQSIHSHPSVRFPSYLSNQPPVQYHSTRSPSVNYHSKYPHQPSDSFRLDQPGTSCDPLFSSSPDFSMSPPIGRHFYSSFSNHPDQPILPPSSSLTNSSSIASPRPTMSPPIVSQFRSPISPHLDQPIHSTPSLSLTCSYSDTIDSLRRKADDFGSESETDEIDEIDDDDRENSNPSKNCRNRYTVEQERALVHEWKENLEGLESQKSRQYWKIILEAVNKEPGFPKTLKSIKKKIDRIKALYKKAKESNRKSGRSRQKCPHYEILDSVLNTRAVINMPAVRSAGRQVEELEKPEENESEDEQGETPDDAVVNTPAANGKAKRKRKNKSDSIESMGRILHELQENQNKAIDNILDKLDKMEERAQRQNEGFMLKLVELMNTQSSNM